MGIKQILAERTRKKLRFAVLRPKNKSLIPTEEQFRAFDGMPSDQFQQAMNDTLRDGAIFAGYVKPGSPLLYDENGFPTGGKTERGDVLDKIEDFNAARESGAYVLDPSDLVQ